ncbi:hypothetical protein [Spongiactinospora sp. TRM90649]|uniref:hypothetical protein n=1 Tax=Spongiactinospora sp. TRM90649 TaxID=3031114 RepID=UPI0023F73FCD|nr:hypothetical protein [Spongiactinospora sp. TRM90649]MDF5758560.1 hypothetical protein [Spongiactinospora sp. TRM90649]
MTTETMTVRVRDRASESPWGSGPTNPIVRTVTISAHCPKCGGPRGVPRNLNTCDDGEHYSVDVWENPCRHVDFYADIVVEARALVDGPQQGGGGGLQ